MSTGATVVYGAAVHRLRNISLRTADKEPTWRKKGMDLLAGNRASW